MNITDFKNQMQDHLDSMQNLIGLMPKKGDTTSECQRMTLQQALNELEYALNGTKAEDMVDIDIVVENGEFVDGYPIDEGYTSNAGDAEVYLLDGIKYEVITYNDRAEEHEEGERVLNVLQEEEE